MSTRTVLLLGIDTPIGLSIIRELGEHEVRVIGLGSSDRSLGRSSRYMHQAYVRERNEDDLVSQINGLHQQHNLDAVMAISETDMKLLNRHRAALHPLNLLIPEAELLAKALDKEVTYQYARRVGIQVPETLVIANARELEDKTFLERVDFPVVLKWPDPPAIIAKLRAHNLPLIKAEYARNPEELLMLLGRYVELEEFPLVQKYCPGQGLGQFFLINNGKVIQRFQHLRVHEWPPEGGFSTLCKAIPMGEHVELMQRSEQLLLELGWEGVAMVEYRYDPETDNAYLMEVNGRFWGSLPLAYHCSAQFAWLLFQSRALGETPTAPSPRDDLYCRYMIPETKRLLRVIGNSARSGDGSARLASIRDLCSYLADFLNPKMRYFLFSWKDPLPFLSDVRGGIRKLVRK